MPIQVLLADDHQIVRQGLRAMLEHEGFRVLRMTQQVTRSSGATYETTRCPIHVDGQVLASGTGSPMVGEHNAEIIGEFD